MLRLNVDQLNLHLTCLAAQICLKLISTLYAEVPKRGPVGIAQHMGALTTFTRRTLEGNMPRATVVLTPERRDLETVEGGWVEIRRLSYGEKLQKDQEAMKMRFATEES